MKIKKREFEKLVRDSEKLQHVKAIVLNEDTAFVNREELLRACGLTTEQEEVYVE